MDLEPAFSAAADIIRAIPRSELLMIALAAMIGGWIGSMLMRRRMAAGRIVRTASTIILGAVLLTVVLQLSRFDPRLAVSVPQIGMPEQVVSGGETRVELARDGHFWLRAELNGVPANFLVDTGATITAVSQEVAERAGLEPRRGGIPVRISTANGSVNAEIASADTLRFGNVEARGLDVVIAPSLGTTNVVGMNLLSRLEGWRVEGRTLILEPLAEQVAP